MINGDTMVTLVEEREAIPVGICQCGCGQPSGTYTAPHPGGIKKGDPKKFFGSHRIQKGGPAHQMWKGGRRVSAGGYMIVYAPQSAHANRNGYVLEHVRVAELALGHALPKGAVVHHVDGTKQNNSPFNLVLCQDQSYHFLLHQRQRALDACGNASARKCYICKQYDRQDDLSVWKHGQAVHRSCRRSRKGQRNGT